MIPLLEPTHHQTLIYVDNVALSSLIVDCHCCVSKEQILNYNY